MWDGTIWEQGGFNMEHTDFPHEGNQDARKAQGGHEEILVQTKTQRKKEKERTCQWFHVSFGNKKLQNYICFSISLYF